MISYFVSIACSLREVTFIAASRQDDLLKRGLVVINLNRQNEVQVRVYSFQIIPSPQKEIMELNVKEVVLLI